MLKIGNALVCQVEESVQPSFVPKLLFPDSDAEALATQVPLGRFASPEEVADAVMFLLSHQAAYITGESIAVNGGWQTL